jgi:hypothetical protein
MDDSRHRVINERCRLCERPSEVYRTVSGLCRHAVRVHQCFYRASGDYVPIAAERFVNSRRSRRHERSESGEAPPRSRQRRQDSSDHRFVRRVFDPTLGNVPTSGHPTGCAIFSGRSPERATCSFSGDMDIAEGRSSPRPAVRRSDDLVDGDYFDKLAGVLGDVDLADFDFGLSPVASPPPVIYNVVPAVYDVAAVPVLASVESPVAAVPVASSFEHPVVAAVLVVASVESPDAAVPVASSFESSTAVAGRELLSSVVAVPTSRPSPATGPSASLESSGAVESEVEEPPDASSDSSRRPDPPRLRLADLWACVRTFPPTDAGEVIERIRRRYLTDLTGPELRISLLSLYSARSFTAREIREFITASIISTSDASLSLLQLYVFVDSLASVMPDEL